MKTKAFQRIYTKLTKITKATCEVRAPGVRYGELGWVNERPAQAVSVMGDVVTLQVFSGTEGVASEAEVVFSGFPPTFAV